MRTVTWKRVPVAVLAALIMITPFTADAAIGGAVEKATKRAATKNAERAAHRAQPTPRDRAVPVGKDTIVRQWSAPFCKPGDGCPLPNGVGTTFVGGSYIETKVGAPTRLYRVHDGDSKRLGETYSYWSRDPSTGTKAVLDKGLDVAKKGNRATKRVEIEVPPGTKLFEGRTEWIDSRITPREQLQRDFLRLPGGGNQVVLRRGDMPRDRDGQPHIPESWMRSTIDLTSPTGPSK